MKLPLTLIILLQYLLMVTIWLSCCNQILLVNGLDFDWISSKIDQVSDQWAGIAKAVDKTLPCHFTCPIGERVVRRKNFKVTPNGCGTKEFPVDVSFIPGATHCCDQHDLCYSTCNVKKRKCDDEFLNCLRSNCQINYKHQKETSMKSNCLRLSQVIHSTTLALGCIPFMDAQKLACRCVDHKRDEL